MATTQVEEESSSLQKQSYVLCVPMDSKIPKIRIRTQNAKELENFRILVWIDEWNSDSWYPNGHFVKKVGEIGKQETEIESILLENEILHPNFSEGMIQSLPCPTPANPWVPQPQEVEKRRDLRKSHRIFSIDPIGCEDIDDAMSIRILSSKKKNVSKIEASTSPTLKTAELFNPDPNFVHPKALYELGVHIADVTHFVSMDSLLDLEARRRGTTTYFPDRRLDMLPEVLSTNLCSLREKEDRYSVSVFWQLDPSFNIVSVWMGRTVIRSVHALSYELADRIANDKCSEEEKNLLADFPLLRNEIPLLIEIGRHLLAQREGKGALELESVQFSFDLSSSTPTALHTPKKLEVKKTVAEMMILANRATAEFLHHHFPDSSLLRRHPPPKVKIQKNQFSFLTITKVRTYFS